MAITFPGSITVDTSPDSSSVGLINGVHTVPSGTDLLLHIGIIEGNENDDPSTPSTYDVSGDDDALTLITDSGVQSSSDVRIFVYGLLNPDPITNANVRFDIDTSIRPGLSIWINVAGVDTTSLAAATNVLETVVNTTATSSTAFASDGSSGNTLLAIGGAQGADMQPASINMGFTELVDDQSGTTNSDLSGFVANLSAGLPSSSTITWGNTDQNTGIYLELVDAGSGGTDASESLTGFQITSALGILTTSLTGSGVNLAGFEINAELGVLGITAENPGSATNFNILLEQTAPDVLLLENGDKLLLENFVPPATGNNVTLDGLVRRIQSQFTGTCSTRTVITKTVRISSFMSTLITVTQGDNVDIVYNIQDETGAVLDLTGGTIEWNVNISGTNSSVIQKSSATSSGIVLTDALNGIVTVTVSPTDTSSIGKGTYTLDGQFINPSAETFSFESSGFRVK
jgi:hypothetical protein